MTANRNDVLDLVISNIITKLNKLPNQRFVCLLCLINSFEFNCASPTNNSNAPFHVCIVYGINTFQLSS